MQPGGETALELSQLMGMHKGRGGPHVFAVDIKTNDPDEPVKTVRWRFAVKDITR